VSGSAESQDPLLRSVFLRYESRDVPAWEFGHGRLLHAAFLLGVSKVSPVLAKRLHDKTDFRPFTVAIVEGICPLDASVSSGGSHSLELRITSFDEELSLCLDEVIADGLTRVRVGHVLLELRNVGRTPAEHPDAVAVRASFLADYWMRNHGNVDTGVFTNATLRFLTPATFRHKGMNMPLPLPSLLFARLRQIWNGLNISPVNDEIAMRLADGSMISRYELRTELVRHTAKASHLGFVGWCDITLPRHDEEATRAGHLLLDVGFFAGLGQKTAMGLGAIAPVQRSHAVVFASGRAS
jgi:CRISPR-associated endoribonuclease Cas6